MESPITPKAHGGASSHHGQIKEIADKITSTVNTLYREQRNTPQVVSKRTKLNLGDDMDDLASNDSDDLGLQGNTDLDDDWDVDQSKIQVQRLLSSLHTEKRFDVMTTLSQWFNDKAKKVLGDVTMLTQMDEERIKNEETLRTTQLQIEKDLEEKEMHSFKSSETQEKDRKQFAKKNQKDKQLLKEQEKTNAELETNISDLRSRLLAKEADLHSNVMTDENTEGTEKTEADQPKASDLLQVIASQQDEISQLTQKIHVYETRVKTLKCALDYVSGDLDDAQGKEQQVEVAPEVLETIEEIKSKIREAKIADLMSKQEIGQDAQKVPDEAGLQVLENECVTLRQQYRDLEEEIHAIKETQKATQESLDQTEITPENAPPMKAKLTVELNKVQSENERLQSELIHYEGLITQSEETLRIIEEQKVLFLDSVTAARKNLSIEPLPTEDEHAVPTEAQDNPKDVEALEKNKEVLENLKTEEKELIGEIEELESNLVSTRSLVKEEKEKQKDTKGEIDKLKREYNSILQQLETDIPKTLEEEEEQLSALQNENDQLLAKLEDLQNKLDDEDRRCIVNEKSLQNAEKIAKDHLNEKKKELDQVILESGKSNIMSETSEEKPDKKEMSIDSSSKIKDENDEKLELLQKQQNKDMEDLLKIQAENVELQKQIDLIETKIKLVKSNRGQPLDINLLKDTDVKDEDVPKENLDLRKEVRRKQKELNTLRKKWWAERQDAKNMGKRSNVPDAEGDNVPSEQFDKIKSGIEN